MTQFNSWKYYKHNGDNIGILSPNGQESRLLLDKEVLIWLAEGNTPLPADES